MTFHVGQRVVCVDASPPTVHPEIAPLKLGEVYTVRGFDPESHRGAIYLEELFDPIIEPGWQHEHGWRPDRFRPVIERKRKTSIAIFKKMLTPKTREVVS